MDTAQSRIDKKGKEKKKYPCAFSGIWYSKNMKEQNGYLVALEKGFDAWSEFSMGRLRFRVKHDGKIHTFSSDSSLLSWIKSL